MNVKIIGIGGCGRNILNTLIDEGLSPKNAIFIDTDINAKPSIKSDNFIQLGESVFKGRGTGCNQEKGQLAAMLNPWDITNAIEGADTVILIAGVAGGVGGGALPFITSLSVEYIGAKTIAFAVMPAEVEGKGRKEKAETALTNLKAALDEENIHVINIAAHGTLATMFSNTDKLVAEKIKAFILPSSAKKT